MLEIPILSKDFVHNLIENSAIHGIEYPTAKFSRFPETATFRRFFLFARREIAYLKIESALVPRLRSFKWLRDFASKSAARPQHDLGDAQHDQEEIFAVHLSPTTNDEDHAVTQALQNLYGATKSPLPLTSYVENDDHVMKGCPWLCSFRLRFPGDFNAGRVLLPFLLMPLKRILKIDADGDADGDNWTFEVPAKTSDKYAGRSVYIYKQGTALTSNAECIESAEDSAKTKISKMDRRGIKQRSDPTEEFPFHLFVSPRFMTNYRYEWVPYKFPSRIQPPVHAHLPSFHFCTKEYIIENIEGVKGSERLLKLMNRKLKFVLPKIPQLELVGDDVADAEGVGLHGTRTKVRAV
ncbi:hypothetical protein HK098_003606 [Nowakowskiella sp. JEL0407]|nr:hypothetical protein HK098_003606 [Nowakowskiella sp. JEL0407]